MLLVSNDSWSFFLQFTVNAWLLVLNKLIINIKSVCYVVGKDSSSGSIFLEPKIVNQGQSHLKTVCLLDTDVASSNNTFLVGFSKLLQGI